MTANKGFKKAARARARRTGESYTAARYRLLPSTRKESAVTQLHMRTVTDEALGFSVAVPDDWELMPPRPSRQEVFSAMARPNGRTFVAVSKVLAKTNTLRDNVTLEDWVDAVVEGLLAKRTLDLRREQVQVGGADAVRLDYRFEGGGEVQHTRAYWTLRAPAAFQLVFGTFNPAADEALIGDIAASFRLV